MILKNKKQVVIVNDIKSDCIEQAIFILREKPRKDDNSFTKNELISEAERILNSVLLYGFPQSLESEMVAKKKPKILFHTLAWLASAMGIVGISILILSFVGR